MLFYSNKEGIDYAKHADGVVVPHVLHNLIQSLKCFKLRYIKAITQEVFEELLGDMNIIFPTSSLTVFFDD